jgi:hypothetical protein
VTLLSRRRSEYAPELLHAEANLQRCVEEMVHSGCCVTSHVSHHGDIHVEKVLVWQVLEVYQQQPHPQVS